MWFNSDKSQFPSSGLREVGMQKCRARLIWDNPAGPMGQPSVGSRQGIGRSCLDGDLSAAGRTDGDVVTAPVTSVFGVILYQHGE